MKMKTLLMVLASAVTALACASASAQFSSNSAQDRTVSRGQRNNAQSASESPLSPLLGAPQDDSETYLTDTRASNSAQKDASARNNQTRNKRGAPDSALSPLLGAPANYEDSFISSLDYGPEQQADGGSNASSEGATSHRDAVGTRVAGERRESHEFEPATTLTTISISASKHDSFSGTTISDPASTIYRPPW